MLREEVWEMWNKMKDSILRNRKKRRELNNLRKWIVHRLFPLRHTLKVSNQEIADGIKELTEKLWDGPSLEYIDDTDSSEEET